MHRNNSIFLIRPYRSPHGLWVFDDSDVGLKREPFVPSAGEIIDWLVKAAGIDEAEGGFALLFSASKFPIKPKLGRCATARLQLVAAGNDRTGNTYRLKGTDLEGWLCPALHCYFEKAPKTLYVAVFK